MLTPVAFEVTPEEALAFWKLVDKTGPCWRWLGRTTKGGYGVFTIGGVGRLAHRIAWVLTRGRIPDMALVLHSCPDGEDHPWCVCPDHLGLGDHDLNMKQMAERGRHADVRGEKGSNAQITEAQAREVLRRFAAGERQRAIGADMGIKQAAVSHICTGRTWAHLQPGEKVGKVRGPYKTSRPKEASAALVAGELPSRA